MNISEQIADLKSQIVKHEQELGRHSFELKHKLAKLKKLQKLVDKINNIYNEQPSQPIQ